MRWVESLRRPAEPAKEGSDCYILRGITEHKKSTRRVLYILLELRHSLLASMFDPDRATQEYLLHYEERMVGKGISIKSNDLSPEFRKMIKEHISNINNATKTDIETRLLSQFETSLLEMSCVNPVLAYQIHGKEKFEKIVGHTNDHLDNFNSTFIPMVTETWLKDALESTSREARIKAFDDLAVLLDDDVLLLAKSCGWSDEYKCKKLIKDGINSKHLYCFTELDLFMDSLIEEIYEEARKNKIKFADESDGSLSGTN